MKENFVTIANFNHEWELFVLRNALEAEGVRCFTMNHSMISVRHIVSETMGGIDLMVHQDDLEWAQIILAKLKFSSASKPKLDVIIDDIRYEKAVGFCPHCDDNKVFKEKFIISEFLANLFFLRKQKYICVSCRNKWEQW